MNPSIIRIIISRIIILGFFETLLPLPLLPILGSISICTSTSSVTKPFSNEGNPLILTPFLESGDILRAQELSKVTYFPEVPSYSGYFTTQPRFGSNVFFWYFPAKIHPDKASLLVWLNGGPGSSSLFGLFVENGPFIVNQTSIVGLRKTSWTMTNSVVYIDSPVGTGDVLKASTEWELAWLGFSFTIHEGGYARNIRDVTEGLYSTVVQFLTLFPELQKRDLYLTGESYAGKYIPNLAQKILDERDAKESPFEVSLKGISIGNGFIDPEHSLNYADFLFDLGLVDNLGQIVVQEHQQRILKLIQHEEWSTAFKEYDDLIGYSGKSNLISNLTGLNFYYNILSDKRPPDYDYFKQYMNQSELRKAVHVGYRHFIEEAKVMDLLREDIMQSAKPILEKLLDRSSRREFKILLYSGQLDLIVPNRLTDDFIETLDWFGLQSFLKSQRKIWKLGTENGKEVGGYYKSYLNFARVTLRNCGHMVPYDKPKLGFQLINSFVKGRFHS